MKTWDNYWRKFESLTESLRTSGERQIINELKDAQKYVNGMTDGWYDFKTTLEAMALTNRTKMTTEQVDMLNELIKTLNDELAKR